MDEKRFETLFKDLDRWILQARRHKIAGDAYNGQLTTIWDQYWAIRPIARQGNYACFHNEDREKQLRLLEQIHALSDARALLYGLAIENACKARLIHMGRITIKDGEAKNLRTDHNIMELVKESGHKPNSEESEFLDLAGYQLRVLAKYPIAKNLKMQNQFTGRAVGARQEEGDIVHDLIVSVLKEQALIDAFENGTTAS